MNQSKSGKAKAVTAAYSHPFPYQRDNPMRKVSFLVVSLVIQCSLICYAAGVEEPPYGVGDWPESFGNHRARIQVTEKADAVWVHIPWRRRDAKPESKEIVVVDATTNQRVENVVRVNVQRESGDLLFQPRTVPGEYYVYYMPYKYTGSPYFPVAVYTPPTAATDTAWAKAAEPLAKRVTAGDVARIPAAKVLEFQAINEFHRFDPMEVVATAEEMKTLLAANPSKPYLLFPEDRRYPIRMNDALPQRWIQAGPSTAFRGEACRGEFYVFQIGVYATGQGLEDVRVSLSPLNCQQHSIPAADMRCFNTGGSDWLGRTFSKTVHVGKGRVQPLWVGVQIPKDAVAGVYQGSVTVAAKNVPQAAISLSLAVTDKVLEDAGDADLWRQARLRWLDSKIGLDDEVVAPFTPVTVADRTVSILGRRARIANGGLLDSIQSTFGHSVDRIDAPPCEVLAEVMKFVVETAAGPLRWTSDAPKVVAQSSGAVTWEATSRATNMELLCRAKMECDGYVNFHLTLRTAQPTDLKDIRLEIPLRRDMAAYMMGMGCKGGRRPSQWRWKWDLNHANNQFWIGDVNAGIACKLKHVEDRWDTFNFQKSGMYKDWSNGGQGGCNIDEQGDRVVARAYTGSQRMAAGEELHFNFGLLITPLKLLDKQHWQWRYLHTGGIPPIDKAVADGCSIINLHQGNLLNPYINYPFLTTDKLAAYVKDAHAKGIKKVKFYYTVRELSSYAAEFWALRSLGSEVFLDGPGFRIADLFEEEKNRVAAGTATGSAWLCEHAVSGYVPAWHQPLGNAHYDAAIATTGLSRLHNYYLEGLAWLIKNVGIDGLYLDGVAYDREIMKRVRKLMDRTRPGCLIDFHNGNHFSHEYGLSNCANQFMELMPYINSIWFGEGFDYNETPDYWLVELSGIPYGLFGEMLGVGNPWRGMVYGMASRLGWVDADPRPIWKAWDTFGIQDARMIGYWDPACPIKTDHKDVLATVYVKKGHALVALASWAKEPVACRLKIDWQALGLDPKKARLHATAIASFQEAKDFDASSPIPVLPGRGWLLVIE